MYKFSIDSNGGRCYLRDEKGKIKWHKYGDSELLTNTYATLMHFIDIENSSGVKIVRDKQEKVRRIVLDIDTDTFLDLSKTMRQFHNSGRHTIIDITNFDSFTIKRFPFFQVLIQFLETHSGIKFKPIGSRYKKHISMTEEMLKELRKRVSTPSYDLLEDSRIERMVRTLSALVVMYDKNRLETRLSTIVSKIYEKKMYWGHQSDQDISNLLNFCRTFFREREDQIPENFCDLLDRQIILTQLSPMKKRKKK